jgi:hypothetical protein
MLAEALQSIELADEIIVFDDGSTFDVDAVVAASVRPGPATRITRNPPTPVEDRMKTPRVGKAINTAIRESIGDVIAYLCDDDIFYPSWLADIRKYYDEGGKNHWVKGWWGNFKDWEPRDPIIWNPMMAPHHGLTTGSFAHLKTCATECGVLWSETSVAVHDAFLVMKLEGVHATGKIPNIGLAGWRRNHKFNMIKHTLMDDTYKAGAGEFLGGMVE